MAWQYLPTLDGATFVQVGANCGRNSKQCAVGGDPIWNYAHSCGWRGLVLEPVRNTFKKLCHNYGAGAPNVVPLNAAVGAVSGVSWIRIQGWSEISKLVAPTEEELRRNVSTARVQKVSTLTLSELWPPAGADILVVDAEGGEERILGTALPLPLPRLVLFEHEHLDQSQRHAIDDMLVRQGFEHVADLKHQDGYAVKNNLPPADRLYGRRRRDVHNTRGVPHRLAVKTVRGFT